jgi:hypothetical protein
LLSAKDIQSFPNRLASEVQDFLTIIGASGDQIAKEMAAMENWTFAKTASRQILGSMNDFANMLEAMLHQGATLAEASRVLGDAPCGPINMETPMRETSRLFGVGHVQPMARQFPTLKLVKADN